jgi:hypothetical protein
MKKVSKTLWITLALLIFTIALGFLASSPAPAQFPPPPLPVVPVKVTNTPLPVQGSVSASISNTVPVSGTVNANVTNTVPVSGAVQITNASLPVTGSLSGLITNPVNNPVLVGPVNDSTDREFFFSLCEGDYGTPLVCPGSFDPVHQEYMTSFTAPTTTPSGLNVTRAVIEYVSGIYRADATDDITEVGIEGTFTNNFSTFASVKTPGTQFLIAPPQPSSTAWSWSHTTKIYVPPGASINLLVRSTGIPNEINLQGCFAEFWGTLLTQ